MCSMCGIYVGKRCCHTGGLLKRVDRGDRESENLVQCRIMQQCCTLLHVVLDVEGWTRSTERIAVIARDVEDVALVLERDVHMQPIWAEGEPRGFGVVPWPLKNRVEAVGRIALPSVHTHTHGERCMGSVGGTLSSALWECASLGTQRGSAHTACTPQSGPPSSQK